jgi:hypothetical protein
MRRIKSKHKRKYYYNKIEFKSIASKALVRYLRVANTRKK